MSGLACFVSCVIGIVIGIRIGLWLAEAPISDTAE